MIPSAIVRMGRRRVACAVAGILLMASSAAAQTPRPEARKGPASPRGFSVVLVLGDSQNATTADNVPAAARKALSDMKDFLPYRGYRLLDAQWILGSSHSLLRLRGADDQEYLLTLQGAPMGGMGGRMHMTFQLREPAASTGAVALSSNDARAQLARLPSLRDQLQQIQAAAIRERSRENSESLTRLNKEAAAVRQQIVQLESELQSLLGSSTRSRSVIDTSFNMDVGETVVVGTSRVRGGDKALIALLTAVARGKE
jgi:hypothetical protein